MIKNSTLKSFSYFQTLLLAAVIVFASSFIQPNAPVAEAEVQAKNIRCYPNPAISFVNFEMPSDYLSKGYSLQVFSFTGKKMYESAVSTAKSTLTFTSDFYRGIYIYQLQDKSGKTIETGKFQVNR